jgi:hypothetical protein
MEAQSTLFESKQGASLKWLPIERLHPHPNNPRIEYDAGMWLSSKIIDLMPPREKRRGPSWRNGEKSQEMIYYWHVSDFVIVESP